MHYTKIIRTVRIVFCLVLFFQVNTSSAAKNTSIITSGSRAGRLLNVPSVYPSIAAAVKIAKDGDQIILAAGVYKENSIDLDKAITISSNWKLSAKQDDVDKTIIDAGGKILFNINKPGAEVSGLTIINGNHPLEINASATIIHNHLINNLDAISLEGESGGYVGYNLIENDRDDGIDSDIGDDAKALFGRDIVIEYNTILNSHDDGIEIRLFSRPGQNTNYNIGHNQIIGSGNAGIQLISYDIPTGKIFNIHHNIFRNCKVALGCMEGGRTVEDLKGTSKMDEEVYFYNNTVANNQMGCTGGNHMIAMNNVVYKNALGGFKNFGKQSVIVNNLFADNNGSDLINCRPATLILADTTSFKTKNNLNDFEEIIGKSKQLSPKAAYAFAGKDLVVSKADLTLKGEIIGEANALSDAVWKQAGGPAAVVFVANKASIAALKFPIPGIYEFLFSGSQEALASQDKITVRYVSLAKNHEYFFDGSKESKIQTENYQYAYGNVKEVVKGAERAVLIGTGSSLEYSIGIAKTNEYFIWIKAKSVEKSGQLAFTYDYGKPGYITLNSAEYKWYKLPVGIKTSPGQWSLVIQALNTATAIKDIVFTQDKDFAP